MIRTGFIRTVAAAGIALATLLLSGATPSAASSYTLNFTGTAYFADGFFVAAGIGPGDAVSGSITYNPLSSVTSVNIPGTTSVSVFPQTAGSFTFHVSHAGADPAEYTDGHTADGLIVNNSAPFGDRLGFYIADSVAGLNVSYGTDGTVPALTSLAGLPTDSNGILALLAGKLANATGEYDLNKFGHLTFSIAFTTATTPIPGSLPLFISALGGLGLIASRRRHGA